MKLISLLLVVLTCGSCRPKEIPRVKVETGMAIGSSWRLVRKEPGPPMLSLVTRVLQEGEEQFSNWDPNSEVEKWLRGEVQASAELEELLTVADEVKRASEGAFDVAWDDGCDLGGIAKGWLVDEVVKTLEEEGLENFVFELGGEVAARGNGPAGEGWPVGIEQPKAIHAPVAFQVTLKDEALATSGNYHQPQHLKDGRTGDVLKGFPRSVTVVMPTCAEADAWATALFVLEKEPVSFSGQVYRQGF